MEMIVGQLRYFGASFLCGILSMFVFDFVLVFRKKIHHKKFWILFEDWFFWAMASILVFQMIFALNSGIIRSFFIVSFLGGMILYKKLVKDYVVRGICLIFRPCVWIAKKMTHLGKKFLK